MKEFDNKPTYQILPIFLESFESIFKVGAIATYNLVYSIRGTLGSIYGLLYSFFGLSWNKIKRINDKIWMFLTKKLGKVPQEDDMFAKLKKGKGIVRDYWLQIK